MSVSCIDLEYKQWQIELLTACSSKEILGACSRYYGHPLPKMYNYSAVNQTSLCKWVEIRIRRPSHKMQSCSLLIGAVIECGMKFSL